MKITITRAAALVAVSGLLLTGCTDNETVAAEPSSEPRRSVPADLCDRIDYALAVPAFGEETPIPPEDMDQGPGFRCDKSFFAASGYESGFLQVRVQIFGSPGAARAGFERSAPASTMAPFQGGSEIVADASRYQQSPRETTIELLDANLIVEVRLAAMGAVGDEQAAQIPPASVRIAVEALELIRAA